VRVVSVGNLTVGGTGKSTFCLSLARLLRRRGENPVLVSHAHGRRSGGGPAGEGDWRSLGDEAAMSRFADPALPVISLGDKAASVREAAASGASVIIVDDGFHRLDIRRDLDILLFDARLGPGNRHCLPAGPLREPLAHAARADLVVVTGIESLPAWAGDLIGRHPGLRAIPARRVPGPAWSWPPLAGETPRGITLKGRRVHAFCGIGNPHSFLESLEGVGASVVGRRIFRDHHPYSPSDLEGLADEAQRSGSELAVTTLKDAVKIPAWPGPPPLAVLTSDVEPVDPGGLLAGLLEERITSRRRISRLDRGHGPDSA
jgi:tetraacyldisaccharide 4'-kinase